MVPQPLEEGVLPERGPELRIAYVVCVQDEPHEPLEIVHSLAQGWHADDHHREPERGAVGRRQGADRRSRAVPGAVTQIVDPEQRREIKRAAVDTGAEQAPDAQARRAVGGAVAD